MTNSQLEQKVSDLTQHAERLERELGETKEKLAAVMEATNCTERVAEILSAAKAAAEDHAANYWNRLIDAELERSRKHVGDQGHVNGDHPGVAIS